MKKKPKKSKHLDREVYKKLWLAKFRFMTIGTELKASEVNRPSKQFLSLGIKL